jgi:flagellar hook-associated protein 3 FlgL
MHLTEIIKNQFFPAIADNLNTNIEGRYLFSGNKTNTRAVTDLDKQTNIINNTITSNYYQGNSTILSMQVSENLTLTYGVTADHVAFKNLIACANKAISSDLSNNQNEMAETSRLLQTTIDQLINLHSNISNNIKAIEDANDSLKSKKVNIASDLAKIDDVDQATLMMEFKSEKNALIGTFKIAAEMKDMSLLNYLK